MIGWSYRGRTEHYQIDVISGTGLGPSQFR